MSADHDRDFPAVGTPSKSELKRRAKARQKLVETLVELSDGALRGLGLTDATVKDLAGIRQMRPSQARNRSIRHLASRLLESERAAANAYLGDRRARQADESRRLHQLEQWRDRLLDEGDPALAELCRLQPQLDRQHLRTLVRAAQKERLAGKPPGAARKLFREIREILS